MVEAWARRGPCLKIDDFPPDADALARSSVAPRSRFGSRPRAGTDLARIKNRQDMGMLEPGGELDLSKEAVGPE